MKTPLDVPPTEAEIAELLSVLPEAHKDIVRRLAFQRDRVFFRLKEANNRLEHWQVRPRGVDP